MVVFVMALVAGPGAGHAKVPIPCTGEKIVKVADLPQTEAFTLPGGGHVDLGYLYQSCFAGKWIGYIGNSNRYVTWKTDSLPDLLTEAGLKTEPPEPGIFWGLTNAPGEFVAEWIWIVVLTIVGIACIFQNRGKTGAGTPVEAVAAPETVNTVASATASAAPPPRLAGRKQPPEQSPIQSARTVRQPAPSFGRRG